MRKVVIKGKEYGMKHSLRCLFIYERMAGKPYDGGSTLSFYMLIYATLLANNKDFSLSFDEFIDECDSDTVIAQSYMEMMKEQEAASSAFADNDKKKEAEQ